MTEAAGATWGCPAWWAWPLLSGRSLDQMYVFQHSTTEDTSADESPGRRTYVRRIERRFDPAAESHDVGDCAERRSWHHNDDHLLVSVCVCQYVG